MTLAGTNQRTTMLEKNGVFQAKGSTSMQSLIRRGPQENVLVYNRNVSYGWLVKPKYYGSGRFICLKKNLFNYAASWNHKNIFLTTNIVIK